MNSNTEKQKTADFKLAFDHALEQAGVTLTELASKGSFSRQNIAELKRGNSDPTMGLVRKIWKTLRREYDVDSRELIRLLVAAMGSDISDEDTQTIIKAQPYTFKKHEVNKIKTGLENRCVLTDILAERTYQEALDHTLRQMEKETTYFYFLPQSNTDRQTVLANVPEKDLEKFQKKAYFIKSPDLLFFVRIRIDNIGLPGQDAYYSISPPDDSAGNPVIYPLHPVTIERIVNILLPVVAQVRDLKDRGEHHLPVPTTGGALHFELDY